MRREKDAALAAVRALNFAYREEPATYCGLRMLLDNISSSDRSRWLANYLLQKCSTARFQEYSYYSIFKSISSRGKAQYRRCIALSPTSLLAEVWTLLHLSRCIPFSSRPNVYSYRWGDPQAPFIFQHHMRWYFQRDLDVGLELRRSDAEYVVVADIENFYPSVNRGRLRSLFETALGRSSLAPSDLELTRFVFEPYFREDQKGWDGVPIGPPAGHLLGDVALTHVDARMNAAFPGRYFRYVDDIFIIVKRSDVNRARAALDEALEPEYLHRNKEKDDVVSVDAWLDRTGALASQRRATPGREVAPANGWAIEENDAPFMLRRTLAEPTLLDKSKAALQRWLRGRSGSERAQDSIRKLRKELIVRAKGELEALPAAGMARKWHLQRIRFSLGRLFYLADRNDCAAIVQSIPPGSTELAALRAAYETIATGDATGLTLFVGPTVARVARRWRVESTDLLTLEWPAIVAERERRFASYMLELFGTVRLVADAAGKRQPWERAFAAYCTNVPAKDREVRAFSYLDELRTLQRVHSLRTADLLTTRLYREETSFSDDGSGWS